MSKTSSLMIEEEFILLEAHDAACSSSQLAKPLSRVTETLTFTLLC
jgi:hypothetical protein